MGILSLVWGILALLGFMVGFLPCLGALNWVNIPFALLGLVVGIIATAQADPGDKGMPIGGIVLCSIAIVVGAMRLLLGGGVV
jgi:hypothetical protein